MEARLKRRRPSNENHIGTENKRPKIEKGILGDKASKFNWPFDRLEFGYTSTNSVSEALGTPTKQLRSQLEGISISGHIRGKKGLLIETEDLRLSGEGETDDDCDTESSNESETQPSLPVRYLDRFTFFDENSIGQPMIGLDDIEEPDVDRNISPYFVGNVTSRKSSPQDGSDEDIPEFDGTDPLAPPILLRSSSILRIWESEEPEEDGVLSEYSDIWIQTTYAWYILDRPSPDYRDLYLPRWLHHSLYTLVIHMLNRVACSVDMFKRHFLHNEAKWAFYEFGRELTLVDLRERMPEVLQTLTENIYNISDRSFVEELCAEYAPHLALYPESAHSHSSYSGSDAESNSGSSVSDSPFKIKYKRRYGTGPPIRQKISHLTPTFCTKFIGQLAQPYFPSLRRRYEDDFTLSSFQKEGSPSSTYNLSFPVPNSSPPSIKIKRSGGPLCDELDWVQIWDYKYAPGDFVFIRHEKTPEQIDPRNLREAVWFGLIVRLLSEGSTVSAHILWFIPANHTSLNQMGHPQELVVTNECEEIDAETFIGTCQARKLEPDEDEPEVDGNPLSFFYRYLWLKGNDNDDAFLDVEPFFGSLLCKLSEPFCPSCKSADRERSAIAAKRTDKGVIINDIEYHVHDTVYIVPEKPGQVYIIGQIMMLDCHHASIRECYRSPRPKDSSQFYNDRFLTVDEQSTPTQFSVNRLEEDTFYIDGTTRLPVCSICDSPANRPISGKPLKALDLFSGAGGLSVGLESTGLIEVDWAVEYDPSAARTFHDIHPECSIYTVCLNKVLRHAYDIQRGSDPVPLRSIDTQEELPLFPVEGDVDIIVGGPPCQGFSWINRCPKADDPRNELIISFLSAVEMIKPKYVLLENVRGILTYRLGGHQMEMSKIEGGIKGGVVMLIKRVLTALNYQVRHGVLHAGHYGSPQVRRRVIFVASKRGIHLPDLPQPTHLAINPQSLCIKVPAKDEYNFMVSRRTNHAAPLGPVTVMDAIGDLPRWEWENPHIICQPTRESGLAEEKRSHTIQAISAAPDPLSMLHVSGPGDPVPYGWSPATFYQLVSRGYEDVVSQHFSPLFSAGQIERVCSIPLKLPRGYSRFPDYSDLPEELKYIGRRYHSYTGSYGRLVVNGAFATAIGSLSPDRPSQVIHPTQNRVLTIREFARAQGFPDSVTFHHVSRSVKQITKQIGNAVPVQMAAALGREIVKAEARMRAEGPDPRMSNRGKVGWVGAKWKADEDGSQSGNSKDTQFWVPMVRRYWKGNN